MSDIVKVERWTLIQEIFEHALAVASSERAQYLARACGDDQELRCEVASLLASNAEGTGALHGALAADLKSWARTANVSDAGLRLGPYHLLRELDGGGMGVVYVAVRSDEHYFQIVAVKILRPGLGSPELVQRFRTERQILATLSHPNIGAILDGGDTEDGRPYIVMEYVEGQPITQASKLGGWSMRARVELFCSLCSAVHYAHQKSIIHRDIKPSNVLVTPAGIVKLIDFGISKPLDRELVPGEYPPTQTHQRLMTPDYASPEQILGRKLTTSTDIYSLGVLLFELLTDSRPYTLGELSFAAAERRICDQENRKPSSVRELPATTRRELTGDLDRIVLMAMEKDPARRYASVLHLEEDLRRYLEGRPILAHGPTPIYKLGKFIKRNRTAAWMSCATVIVIGGSALFYIWQARVTETRVSQVANLADAAISDIADKLQQSSASVEVQAALFRGALQHLDQLRRNSGNDPRLLLQLSRAYVRVGDLEGSPAAANLGNLGMTQTSYQEALGLAIEAHKRLNDDASLSAIAEACDRLGTIETYLGHPQRSIDYYRQALSWAQSFWGNNSDNPTRKKILAMSYNGMGKVQLDQLEPDEALNSFRTSLQVYGAEPNGNLEHDARVVRLHRNVGRALADLGSLEEALVALRRSIAIAESVANASPAFEQAQRNLFVSYVIIGPPLAGEVILNAGDINAAQAYARKALTIAEQLTARDSQNAQARADMGYGYSAMGDAFRQSEPARAASYYREAIAVSRKAVLDSQQSQQERFVLAARDEFLADVLSLKQQTRERLEVLEEANRIWQELAGSEESGPQVRRSLMRSYCRMSDAELALNDRSKAKQHAELSLPFFNEFKLTSRNVMVLRDVGFCYENLGNVRWNTAGDDSFPAATRRAARADAHEWYRKSAQVWNELNRRGIASPESTIERDKLEQWVHATE